MKRLLLASCLGLPFLASARPAPEPAAYALEQVPAGLAAGVEAAQAAADALQRRLLARLSEELRRGGPIQAVAVCRDEAQALTRETASGPGLRIGRTSHLLRNPSNAAPPWAARFVADAAGKKAPAVAPVVVDLGDRIGLLRPIPQGVTCGQCHGPADQLSAPLRDFLKGAYPHDRAVGFREGDLRGFIWVEADLRK